MRGLARALRELVGLFLEDSSLTAGILVCLALAMLGAHRGGIAPPWRGPLFVVGLAIVLLENVRRTARK
jgi:hypothetical protein